MNDLHTIAAELEQARQDHDLMQRLLGAAERVDKLTQEYETAKVRSEQEAAEKEAAEKARIFASITDLEVTEVVSPYAGQRAGPLHCSYKIAYTRPSWDMYAKANLPQRYEVNGFRALSDDVMLCLIEKFPDRIPARIMALAPGDAGKALRLYFRGLSRGHL